MAETYHRKNYDKTIVFFQIKIHIHLTSNKLSLPQVTKIREKWSSNYQSDYRKKMKVPPVEMLGHLVLRHLY